jgi:D-alanyl-D-alanine carboxypeptidase/D-alanyl-D-alanine-endopeptidase (penicillin-binding protein 4)
MWKILSASLLLLAACVTAPPSQRPPSLAQFIDESIDKPPFHHAIWGILVEDERGRVLYARNPDTLLMPASNRKMFISALVADCEDLDATIPTDFWIDGDVVDGALRGDLVIQGHGDPSFGGRLEPDRDLRLRAVLAALRARGISRIAGGVIADVSDFDREIIPGSWQTDDLPYYYAARVDALAFNENVAGVALATDCERAFVTTDPHFVEAESEIACAAEGFPALLSDQANHIRISGEIGPEERATVSYNLVAVEQPGLYAAQAVDEFFERVGIAVDAPPRLVTEKRAWRERLITLESPPLSELLSVTLKPSQNLYAEMLFKRIATGETPATYQRAIALEKDFLQSVGLDPTEYRFADGSGMSVQNLVTPRAVVKLLRHMNHPYRRGAYSLMLAIPGEEGTLRRRLAGLEERLRGKTGTIFGVNALIGYVIGSRGDLRYFSIIVNHHAGWSRAATAIIDDVVRKLAEF